MSEELRTWVPHGRMAWSPPRIVFVHVLIRKWRRVAVVGPERRGQCRVDWVFRIAAATREASFRVRICPVASRNLAAYGHALRKPQARLPHVTHTGAVRTIAAPAVRACDPLRLDDAGLERVARSWGTHAPLGTQPLGIWEFQPGACGLLGYFCSLFGQVGT